MTRKEMLQCETCGSYIDPETGETLPPTGGNAKKITDMSDQIETLQSNLDTALKANEELLEKLKGKSGGSEQEPETRKSIIDDIL